MDEEQKNMNESEGADSNPDPKETAAENTDMPAETTTDPTEEVEKSEPQDAPQEDSAPETAPAESVMPATGEQDQKNSSKKGFMKNKKTVMMLVVALLLAAAAAFFLLTRDNGNDTANTQTEEPTTQRVTTLGVTIATVEGSVQYSSDGATWTDAEGGESLAHLDYIRTLEGGRAIVLFDDGSVARLDSNSELYLSSLQVDGLEVTLVNGQVYSRVVASENQSFTVVTANERFKALGTAYKTSTSGEKDELEVYQSNVKVESEDLDVAEGNKYDTATKVQGEMDLEELDGDDFVQWNKQKDSENDEFKDKLGILADRAAEEAPAAQSSTPAQNSSAGITLSASKVGSGVVLTWTMSGVSSTNGFKVVRDKTDSTPSYGEDSARYISNKSARDYLWSDSDGKTYYYRVCIYRDGGTCDTYSNTVQVASPLVEKDPVVAGGITLTISGKTINWSLVGGTAPHGYKVVLSSQQNPTYPGNSIQYVSPGKTSATLPEKAAGTYYVRICKYTNGTQTNACVDYSNQVTYVID